VLRFRNVKRDRYSASSFGRNALDTQGVKTIGGHGLIDGLK
jgi:hypothetical protein